MSSGHTCKLEDAVDYKPTKTGMIMAMPCGHLMMENAIMLALKTREKGGIYNASIFTNSNADSQAIILNG